MKRLTAGVGALLVGAAGLFATAGAVGATLPRAVAATLPRAQLRAFACQNALDPGNRSVSVTSVMRPLPGTVRMSVRFELFSTQAGGARAAIHSGDLGAWIRPSNPTLGQLPGDIWKLQKQVLPLAAPATYRFRVSFRWFRAHNRILATAHRQSPRCHQHELRPDLAVQTISVSPRPNQPNRDVYTAVIANQGNGNAGPFLVLFAPGDGSATTTRTVGLLAGHSARSLSFVGPLCTSASAPTITADSALSVHDLNRDNNALTATCPGGAGG